MKKTKIFIIFLVFFLGFGQPVCHAVEIFEGLWQAFDINLSELEGVVLGVGALYSPSVYEGKDDEVWSLPIVAGKYKRLFFYGRTLGYILNESETLYFSLIGQPRFGGFDPDDSDTLSGMEEREWSLDGGIKMSWKNEWFLLNVEGITDILNRHNGHELRVVVSKSFYRGGFTPRVGMKWQSDNLVEYYYGVAGTEARTGRSAYEGDQTINMIAGFSVGIPLGGEDSHWAVTGDFEYEMLGSEIEDSPIVDADERFTTIVGLVYRF